MISADYLQEHALFGGLARPDLEALIPRLKEGRYSAGEFIVHEGKSGSRMFFIRKGAVEVLKRNPETQTQTPLARLGEGDTFGEMELIDVQPRSASVRAISELTVWTLSSDDLYEIFEQNQAAFIIIIMNMAREISRRLRAMDALVASSLFNSPNDDTT